MILFAQQNEAEWQTIVSLIGGVVILVILMVVFGVFARYFRLWIQCVLTKASISIWDLLGMTFRKVNPAVIVRSKIMAVQAGLTEEMGITSRALEAHYLAGGNVPLVIRALIAAQKAKIIQLSLSKPASIPRSSIARRKDPASRRWMRWPRTASSSRFEPASRSAPTSRR